MMQSLNLHSGACSGDSAMGLMMVGFDGRFLRELVLRFFGFSGANSGRSGSADGMRATRGGGGASSR
jgi:hypothetical protein